MPLNFVLSLHFENFVRFESHVGAGVKASATSVARGYGARLACGPKVGHDGGSGEAGTALAAPAAMFGSGATLISAKVLRTPAGRP
ncbi:MAG: hypothetical protein Q7S58_08735, partial [Candidatus Binatus sp.]|uniref:hypothetical protein n=1 Tax=Candidatus Binatus sp. TaxID=2811406 RepID=UPI0027273504